MDMVSRQSQHSLCARQKQTLLIHWESQLYGEHLKLLHQRFEELVADGELSSQDEDVLTKTAILLGLEKSDLESLARKGFLEEISTRQRRVEQTWQLTDEDLAEIENLKNKYGITRFRMEGNAGLFRQVYLLEAKGQMPPAISADWMLDADERAYYCIASTWHQTRVRNHGYAGASFSVPTGMRGVRLRFGQYSPVRSEEVTPLASGTLWVTSKRLVFQGDTRNTKVDHKKIIDTHIYSDSSGLIKLLASRTTSQCLLPRPATSAP